MIWNGYKFEFLRNLSNFSDIYVVELFTQQFHTYSLTSRTSRGPSGIAELLVLLAPKITLSSILMVAF